MPSLRRALALAAVPMLSLAAACGGSVATSTGGSGGDGTGAGSGTGGGAGGEASVCPASEPVFGTPCSTNGLSCSYGNECCPSIYECAGSTWQALPTGCADPPVMCPADPPAAGSGCNVCFEPGPCTYPCSDPAVTFSASCAGGVWTLAGECPVPPPVACGNTTCNPGEICVESEGGAGFSYGCAPDPCAPGPLSCDCAMALCGGSPFQCDSAMGQMLICGCPTCA